jgi:hypothetical protein
MYNYYRTPWLRDRLANTLEVAFGHTPCVDDEGFSLSMLSVTINPSALHCTSAAWHRPANVVPPATDDHPFVYLQGNSIPWLYRITLVLILLASILLVRPAAGPYRRMTGYVDLFFMGAAFMLLETKNIVQFALLFGTTWFVNALVTAGVLVAVLAAVEVSRHVAVRRPALLYAALLAALIVAWAVPPSSLLSLSPLPRFVLAVIIAFAPIFLANMVFTQRFRDTGDSATAFGANLLGAMVGGVLEYASLVVGYRWLLVFVAVLYGLAFLTGYRHLRIAGLRSAPTLQSASPAPVPPARNNPLCPSPAHDEAEVFLQFKEPPATSTRSASCLMAAIRSSSAPASPPVSHQSRCATGPVLADPTRHRPNNRPPRPARPAPLRAAGGRQGGRRGAADWVDVPLVRF